MIFIKLALIAALNPLNTDSAKVQIPDKIVLSIHQYPMRQTRDYVLNSKGIKIMLSNRNKDPDSILMTKSIRLKRFNRIAKDFASFKKEKYANPCISDGQVLRLTYLFKDSVLKIITFSSYYEDHLAKMVSLINHHVKHKYFIPYDKIKLIKALKECN